MAKQKIIIEIDAGTVNCNKCQYLQRKSSGLRNEEWVSCSLFPLERAVLNAKVMKRSRRCILATQETRILFTIIKLYRAAVKLARRKRGE